MYGRRNLREGIASAQTKGTATMETRAPTISATRLRDVSIRKPIAMMATGNLDVCLGEGCENIETCTELITSMPHPVGKSGRHCAV